MDKLLSVIIANRNDVSMLAVTVRSCIEELQPLGKDNWEIVICDNSDEPTYNLLRSALPTGYIREGKLKLLRQPFPCLFSARQTAVEKASGKYVICLDSHMIVGHDAIVELTNFMERRASDLSLGFAHAPISWAHQHESRAKHDRDMSVNELGNWGLKHEVERTITWKGMPWICRRDWFLNDLGGYGVLAKHRISWGGGDMYLGVKPWLLGFKNWAVPCRPFIHIGPFPKVDQVKGNPNVTKISKSPDDYRYRLYSSSGNHPHAFGFLVSCYVLGGTPMMERNKEAIKKRFGQFINVERNWNAAIGLGKEDKEWLDARKVMSFEELLERKPWDDRSGDLQTMAIEDEGSQVLQAV